MHSKITSISQTFGSVVYLVQTILIAPEDSGVCHGIGLPLMRYSFSSTYTTAQCSQPKCIQESPARTKRYEGEQGLTFWNPMYILPICRECAVEKVVHGEVLDALYAERCPDV